ncbi:DUF1788 domain-containing protein [Pseudomonas sp.]|uniref:DUF1788 domain-containing protein n=1 Tax=Pseudomonas sp. TaxID=306 RepID=UPI004053DA7F
MSQKISQQPLAARFEHLVSVMSGQRFLEMRGLNNDLPFYICEFKAAEAFEIQRMQRQLINTLAGLRVDCLQGRGVKVLEINLYDLAIELLKAREGSEPGMSVWDQVQRDEQGYEKEALLELLQGVLDIKEHLIPAIGERIAQADYDVLFLSGIGEVFPYIRSHNVLNNLQSTAKDKPTVMFFPGEYRHSLEQGGVLQGSCRVSRFFMQPFSVPVAPSRGSV